MKHKEYCDFCCGKLTKEKIDLDLKVNGKFIILESILADVCKQCGESYINADDSKKIDKLIRSPKLKTPEKYINVPVYTSF